MKRRAKEERIEGGQGKPGDDYNQRTTQSEVRDLLLSHGWRIDKEVGGLIYLTRPGKSSGVSGLLGFDDDPTGFYVFTENAQPLVVDKFYDPFGLLTALDYNGDFAAAARDLGAKGYGEQRNDFARRIKGGQVQQVYRVQKILHHQTLLILPSRWIGSETAGKMRTARFRSQHPRICRLSS